jgi:hypothetical protein
MNDLHFGFVVGINRYPGISDLQGPVRDAEAFRGWLLDPAGGGLPEQNVTFVEPLPEGAVVRVGDARPTRSDLVSALFDTNDNLGKAIGDDPDKHARSRLYLFMAGHGIAPSGGDAALLPANARRGLFGENLEVAKCRNWYTECGVVAELVIFCDFCRNRINLAESGPLGFTRCASAKGKVETFTGYATAYDRPAYEQVEEEVPADKRRGFFSRALIEGLNGAGAGDGDVTSATLEAYVRQRVRDLTAGLTPQQEARFPQDLGAPLRFGGARPAVPWRTVVFDLSRMRGPLRLLDHRHRPVAEWAPGSPPQWVVSLPDGLYAVVHKDTGRGDDLPDEGLFKVIGEGRHVRL